MEDLEVLFRRQDGTLEPDRQEIKADDPFEISWVLSPSLLTPEHAGPWTIEIADIDGELLLDFPVQILAGCTW